MTKNLKEAVKRGKEHAPMLASSSEERHEIDELLRKDCTLHELVAAADHQGQHARFNPTKPAPGDIFSPYLFRSSAGFLLSKEPAKVTLNPGIIKKEMDYCSKKVVVAYFLGGSKKMTL